MAHPDTNVAEASDAPTTSGSPVEDFADFLDTLKGDEEEEQDSPDEGDIAEGDEPEEAQDEAQEPAEAIDAPVSWGQDAKEVFGQLPPELQKQVAERETQRERFVQQKASEAAEAKRTAQAEAMAQFAETQASYANELEQYASLLAPRAPDPMLLQSDPITFYQLQAQFEQAKAQHHDMVQRSAHARQEAQLRAQQAEQANLQANIAILEQAIPEWGDLAARQALLTDVERIGAELGYTPEVMAMASAQDVLALRKAAQWKADAAKYHALQKTKMAKVREAKTLPKVSRPGVAQTQGEMNATKSQAAWQNVKTAKSKTAQAAAFGDWLEASGNL